MFTVFPRVSATAAVLLTALALAAPHSARADKHPAATDVILPEQYGPFSGHLLRGGRGLLKALPESDPVLQPTAPWTISAWIEPAHGSPSNALIAGVGDPLGPDSRYFALEDGKPALHLGRGHILLAAKALPATGWHLWTARFDGLQASFFVDGLEVASSPLAAARVAPELQLGPVLPCAQLPCPHFGGRIAQFRLARTAATDAAILEASKSRPDPSLVTFEEGSKPWAVQIVQFAGNLAPQNPATLPQPRVPFQQPKAGPLPPATSQLAPTSIADQWTIEGGWLLRPAPEVTATAEQISRPGFDTKSWLPATVPGTVLTTLIQRGLFPDPDYGLNNLAIPESLNKQDYWYRVSFIAPDAQPGRPQRTLVLDGINYHAEIWLNGHYLGSLTGAFRRGIFDVTGLLHAKATKTTDAATVPGQHIHADARPATDLTNNILAIRISPAPHPGIPNAQSIAFGAGLNGGAMELDGPTFMATEGWDWFPPMRDRDTGIWQDVRLIAEGSVSLEDPQVITHLPLPSIETADLTINLPVHNSSTQPVNGVISVSFEGVHLKKSVLATPGDSTVTLTPREFPALHLLHPRLWWPNGYGAPNLYHLQAQFVVDGEVASEQQLQFGVREVTYELSLLDNSGALRRVVYDPTLGRGAATPQVDVTHAGMRQIPNGWASSITPGDDKALSLATIADTRGTPDLILKINGVRIATRGGSWGMEDTRKRISRAHLEPFFRYDRDAHVNIIRNWQGQDTEPIFYELADEYGMMVWNDFWEVTQDSNAEAEDPQLFLANARDTILRYRNHPSIVMWCGRNEGVPQPIINKGLIALTHALDGTRYYSPSSNQVNLEPSGPYSYQDPAAYYTTIDKGFAVEIGTPSLPTLEWFSRWLPKADQWPISDDWAYHNWHPYDALNQHMDAMFGASTSLAEYVRKAQMMNYVDYRAIFEGFNQHLWAPNGGRLLWMTQPAWPSTLWGILSSDYDTQASFYATRKACEPVHIQLDLSNDAVAVINTTREPLQGLTASADVYSLQNALLAHSTTTLNAAADDVTPALQLALGPLMRDGVVLVRLQLRSTSGKLLSTNTYWRATHDSDYRARDAMPSATVTVAATLAPISAPEATASRAITVHLCNRSAVASLATKLVTLYADSGEEVLPAYYSDNYISLLPNEDDTVSIDLPADPLHRALLIKLRGWNVAPSTTLVHDR
jgi:beta-galactosidase/beta-glucuronidase